jgi:predicted kinase
MKPSLIILCGIPFSGKTTLSKKLSSDLNFVVVDLDDIKFEMFGNEIKDEEIDQSNWDKIYQKMYQKVESLLGEGSGVIHDTGNFTIYERGLINKIAKKLNVPFVTIMVDIPVNIAKERLIKNRELKQRFDISDESFHSAVAEMERPTLEENPIVYGQGVKYETLLSELRFFTSDAFSVS